MPEIYAGAQPLDSVISGLRAARQNGRLVPFVGAGVSRPYCNSWKGFIQTLGESLLADLDLLRAATAPNASPEEMNRVADRLTAWLRLHSVNRQREFLRNALRSPQPGPADLLPLQAEALVANSWPLIITSNYDDILPVAIERRSKKHPVVLGRSSQDCVQVVRAMDTLQSPIVWYVQGHVPGVVPPTAAMPDSPQIDALLDEVVIGHQQYQQAINGSPTFRSHLRGRNPHLRPYEASQLPVDAVQTSLPPTFLSYARRSRAVAGARQFLVVDRLAPHQGPLHRFRPHDVHCGLAHNRQVDRSEAFDAAEFRGEVGNEIAEPTAWRLPISKPGRRNGSFVSPERSLVDRGADSATSGNEQLPFD